MNLQPLNSSKYKFFLHGVHLFHKKSSAERSFYGNFGSKRCLSTYSNKEAMSKIPLAIQIENKIYHFQCRALPFGLSSSPRIFITVLAEAQVPLRLQSISIVPYLDNLLLMAHSEKQLCQDLEITQLSL